MPTEIRRWKHAAFQPPADAPFDQTITHRKRSAPRALHFVNTARPGDATSGEAIGPIRSHVAKEIHATRRQLKWQEFQARPEAQGKPGKKGGPGGRADELGAEGHAVKGTARHRSQAKLPGPETKLASAARRDPFNSLARPLNDVELSLIDYYLAIIIPQTFGNGETEARSVQTMTSVWVPFALSDTGLLYAVLVVTCTILFQTQGDRGRQYARMAAAYKGYCIRSIINALSEEGPLVSYATVAKTVVMCSYEIKFGDYSAARCHAAALGKMVELIGGAQNITADDRIGQFLVSSLKDVEKRLAALAVANGEKEFGSNDPHFCLASWLSDDE